MSGAGQRPGYGSWGGPGGGAAPVAETWLIPFRRKVVF